MCGNWFHHCKHGDVNVDDHLRDGRPKTFEDDELKELLDEYFCETQNELDSALGITLQAISI